MTPAHLEAAGAFVQATALRATAKNSALAAAGTYAGKGSLTARLVEKAAIGTGSLATDSDFRAASRGFMHLVETRSLLGKIGAASAFRKVPFALPYFRETLAPTATWVGQGGRKLATSATFEREQIDSRKIATILVVTEEIAQWAGQGFTSELSRDLARAIALTESTQLMDPTAAGVANVSPASLLYGVTPIFSSGADADAIRTDFERLLSSFLGDLETAVIVMNPKTAVQIGFVQKSLGKTELGVRGGELMGIPVVTSSAVMRDSTGSPIAIVDPSRILLGDDGVMLDTSDETSLTFQNGSGASTQVSMFQTNSVALLAERFVNWEAMPGAVSWISHADYDGLGS
jgi:hypothetical protein